MIPFASQRALGQDLATHLLNAQDNEVVELADVRGAIARDLHGAFAEWEFQAHALTRCEKYLYSLSINPDPAQGPLSREQYSDYIARAEERLGLTGQPRAVIFHEKYGREHCHVVWSRIDATAEKAIHIAFDKDKLMKVTREFARDHGLSLPDGYSQDRADREKNPQVSLYEMHAQRETGLTREERMEQVTDAWRASDSPIAFVRALADKGYILATGDRPYVLVDLYGTMHSLPRLISDKSVRTKDVRAFLKTDYPPESLPTVDEAKELAASHRFQIEAALKHEQRDAAINALKRRQAQRKEGLQKDWSELRARQHKEREELGTKQRRARDDLRAAHMAQTGAVKNARFKSRATGLAAFLGRVTGVNLIVKKLHKRQDKKRLQTYMADREILRGKQQGERLVLQRAQEMRSLDMQRKSRALEHVEKRERNSLEQSLRQEARIHARGGRNQIPAMALDLKPRGRRAAPHKAQHRFTSPMAREPFKDAHAGKTKTTQPELREEFARAADDGKGDTGKGSSDGPKPKTESKVRRYGRRKTRDKDLDRGR